MHCEFVLQGTRCDPLTLQVAKAEMTHVQYHFTVHHGTLPREIVGTECNALEHLHAGVYRGVYP